jgi:hypothetical protein
MGVLKTYCIFQKNCGTESRQRSLPMTPKSLTLFALFCMSVPTFAEKDIPITGEWADTHSVLGVSDIYWFRASGSGSSGLISDGNARYAENFTWERDGDTIVVRKNGSESVWEYEETKDGKFLVERTDISPRRLKKLKK